MEVTRRRMTARRRSRDHPGGARRGAGRPQRDRHEAHGGGPRLSRLGGRPHRSPRREAEAGVRDGKDRQVEGDGPGGRSRRMEAGAAGSGRGGAAASTSRYAGLRPPTGRGWSRAASCRSRWRQPRRSSGPYGTPRRARDRWNDRGAARARLVLAVGHVSTRRKGWRGAHTIPRLPVSSR